MFSDGTPCTRVLVTGNRDDWRPIVSALEESKRHHVIEAADSLDALSLLRQELADIAVFDLTLSGLDAFEILQEVHSLRLPVPVIFLTDSRDVSYAVDIMRAGAADYLLKPVLPADLDAAVERAVKTPTPDPDAVAGRRHDAAARRTHRLETLGRLTGAVAHELNNQLTVMLGLSSLVLNELPDPHPLREHIWQIHRSAERAGTLSRQLLEYSRKREQRTKLIDLNLLVAGMERMIERLFSAQVEVETSLKARPAAVQADPAQLEQVILNLVLNARDALPGGGRLTIATHNEVLHKGKNGTYPSPPARPLVILSVRDTGHGMDAATRAHMFEPFFTTKPHGTGLGLSITARTVQQHGGDIEVDSAPNQGTTVRIRLPQQADNVPQADAQEHAPATVPHGSETLLIAEDDGGIRHLLREYLRRHGYTVLEAATGSQALRHAQDHPGRIDLVITDISLPQMDGLELARRVAILRPEIKVLYTSGSSNPLNTPAGTSEADIPFLQKPFYAQDLLVKVRQILDRSGD